MSTVAERMAEAFTRATGEAVGATKNNRIARDGRSLDVMATSNGGGYLVKATATAKDSLNIEYVSKVTVDSTDVCNMEGALSEAMLKARALANLSDMLGLDGWNVRSLPLIGEVGLRAIKGDQHIQVYGDGSCHGRDFVAVKFADDAFEVALERARSL